MTSIKCIDRSSQFLLLSTTNLRLVDCKHSVAAGTSLDQLLGAYVSEVNRFYFPYEHLTRFDVLREACMPPYQSSFSFQRKEKVVEIEMNSYLRSGGSLDAPIYPKTGSDNYDDIKQTLEIIFP